MTKNIFMLGTVEKRIFVCVFVKEETYFILELLRFLIFFSVSGSSRNRDASPHPGNILPPWKTPTLPSSDALAEAARASGQALSRANCKRWGSPGCCGAAAGLLWGCCGAAPLPGLLTIPAPFACCAGAPPQTLPEISSLWSLRYSEGQRVHPGRKEHRLGMVTNHHSPEGKQGKLEAENKALEQESSPSILVTPKMRMKRMLEHNGVQAGLLVSV